MSIGEEVRRLRRERGWSQARLAEESGMSVPGISYIENGARLPNSTSLLKLAEGLDVGIEELYPKASRRSSSCLEKATR